MQEQAGSLYTLEQVKKDRGHDYVLVQMDGKVPMYRRMMDEDDTYQFALEEWLGILSQLWTAYGKQIDAEQMMVYQRSLSVLPLGLLDVVIQRVIRENTYNNVPTVGRVWEAVRKELGNPYDVDDAIRAWVDGRWSKVVYRFGDGEDISLTLPSPAGRGETDTVEMEPVYAR